MKKHTNVFEDKYASGGFSSQRRYPNEALLSFLGSNFFGLSKEERTQLKVLELGCGPGGNLWMVAHEGFDAYGIDLAETGIEICDKRLSHWGVTANLRHGDMTDLPYKDSFFDVIFDVVSMQHLNYKQHMEAYGEAFRCLKEDGLFFSYHLGENSISLKSTCNMIDHCTVENIADGYPLANNGQTCFISANEVRYMLGNCGFKGIIIEKVNRSYSNQTQYIEYLSIVAKKSR